jgi:hypothetical protein
VHHKGSHYVVSQNEAADMRRAAALGDDICKRLDEKYGYNKLVGNAKFVTNTRDDPAFKAMTAHSNVGSGIDAQVAERRRVTAAIATSRPRGVRVAADDPAFRAMHEYQGQDAVLAAIKARRG